MERTPARGTTGELTIATTSLMMMMMKFKYEAKHKTTTMEDHDIRNKYDSISAALGRAGGATHEHEPANAKVEERHVRNRWEPNPISYEKARKSGGEG